MPSPFPGMDPYLEGALWPDVHHELASEFRRQLNRQLGPGYVARVSTRTVTDVEPEEEIGVMYPDVGVFRKGRTPSGSHQPSVATATPVGLVIPVPSYVSIRLARVEIRQVKTKSLVTVIEILSPVNKRGEGLQKYRRKRKRIQLSHVNLLEIDLLRRGDRVIPGNLVPACDYLAALTRARMGSAELWPFSIRDPLPTVLVPLRRRDGDLPLALGEALKAVYDDGKYWKDIDYTQSPPPPELSEEDAAWVREIVST